MTLEVFGMIFGEAEVVSLKSGRVTARSKEVSAMGDPRHFGPLHKSNSGHGHTVFWHRHGGQFSAKTHGYETEQEAKDAAFAIAADNGYTPPRWWQFSRWGDSKP